MTYNESLEYINSLLRFGVRPGLERISELCERLGNPQNKLKFIHVAGTNGKGSVCAYLASVFERAGYKTAMYTSPYVTDFRERFQINSNLISKDDLCAYTEIVKSAAEKMEDTPTEFEFITALAFLYFAKKNCDIVVLEVGLGGRWDATNIVTPLCSVITSIGLDHTAILGDTLAKIAGEKAGIIKNGVPTICPSYLDESALSVIKQVANEKNSPFYICENKFSLPLKIKGKMQPFNASLCALAVEKCGLSVSLDDIEKGIMEATIPARCEFLSENLLLDGGHNPQAVEVLTDCIKQNLKTPTALIGMMGDKDVESAVSKIAPLCKRIITVPVSNPRAISPKELCDIAKKYCDDVICCESTSQGVDLLMSEQGDKIACGSFYLAGEIRDALISKLNS